MSNQKRDDRGRLEKPNLPPHRYVDRPRQWQQCLEAIGRQPRVAIDLEANSMYAYQEEICLIQISIPGQDYVVDPLARLDLEPFGELIGDPGIEKVFHAAEYDLILMQRQFGWESHNLFDTMWAARILGYDRIGLASILEELYGLRLDKRHQRANWCRRPLSQSQLAYAQADTHYLLGLRDHFGNELVAAGREIEAREIFAEQSQVTIPDTTFDPDDFWTMNGARHLPAAGKATLKALTIYRDQEAQRRDRPHFKILQDKTLLEIAATAPRHKGELREIYGMSSGQMQRYGDDILRLVSENRQAPAPRRPRPKPRPPDDVVARYEALREWRKLRGLERGVESDVILSKDTLWALAESRPRNHSELSEIDGLGPWRRAKYGDEILAILYP